jgi:hypothetical protein
MYPKFTKPTEMKKGGKKKKSSSKPKPTNPSLWSRAKSQARSKFDVYPSAYANAWASKWYKSKGGGWRGGSKKKAEGGPISYEQGASEGDLMKIQNGGTHEESPLGGVPIGKDADGREVLVEEGETIRKGAEQDFVFSDRLKLTKEEAEEFGIDKKFVGQSFATVSEKLEKRSPRKSDPIDRQTLDMHLNKLEEAQETFKQRKLAEAKEMYGDPEAEMQQGPEGLPPDAMPGVGTETPPSPEQFAGSPPEVQAMLAQRFPEQFGGGMPQGMPPGMPAGMPQGASPMMMPYGGPYKLNKVYLDPASHIDPNQAPSNYLTDNSFIGMGENASLMDMHNQMLLQNQNSMYDGAIGNLQQESNMYQDQYGQYMPTNSDEVDQAAAPSNLPPNYSPTDDPSFTVMPSFLQASQDELDQSALEDAESRGAATAPNSLRTFTPPTSPLTPATLANMLGAADDGGSNYGAAMPIESEDPPALLTDFPEYESPKGLNALQAAPIASNIATAAALPDKFDFNRYKLPLDDSILQKKDITPLIRDVERMVATGRGALQSRAGSVSELLAGLSNLTAVGMAETGKIRNQQYQDYVQELRNQQLVNLNISKINADTRGSVDAANADLDKERLSLINSAATEASKLADALRQESLSKYELEQLYAMYPYLNSFKNNK